MEKTAFDIGVADGISKMALRAETISSAAAKRGVTPMFLKRVAKFYRGKGATKSLRSMAQRGQPEAEQILRSRGENRPRLNIN